MKLFADLLEKLLLTPSRNRKVELIVGYCRRALDPDRGYAIGAITRDLKLKTVQPSMIRELIMDRTDEELFRLSYDYVGDLAETIALLWDWAAPPHSRPEANDGAIPYLGKVVHELQSAKKHDIPKIVAKHLDAMSPSERYALIKLATGGLRIGVSARLAKQALAAFGEVDVTEIEELWHGLEPPYENLFAWLEGRAEKPVSVAKAPFRPVMLSNALEEREFGLIDPETHFAEWKWDGIRVQVTNDGGVKRLYSRTGDDISQAFPDLVEALEIPGSYDGELLVRSPLSEPLAIRTFSDLQQRLNRKAVSGKMLETHPAFIRIYDVLVDGREDRRRLPLEERREVLENRVVEMDPDRFDLSELIEFRDFQSLKELREDPPHPGIEGLMLKRRDSIYEPGRPRGPWYKWKRDPMIVDAVLMYAQRGHGKRSGFYSDFTFGCWREGESGQELVPVGKAYFGFTDQELRQLDKFVRDNTIERFGPVRSVIANPDKGLVLEIAFEGINRSARHKSGVAMRFPRISRIRWDKPPGEANWLGSLEALIGDN